MPTFWDNIRITDSGKAEMVGNTAERGFTAFCPVCGEKITLNSGSISDKTIKGKINGELTVCCREKANRETITELKAGYLVITRNVLTGILAIDPCGAEPWQLRLYLSNGQAGSTPIILRIQDYNHDLTYDKDHAYDIMQVLSTQIERRGGCDFQTVTVLWTREAEPTE